MTSRAIVLPALLILGCAHIHAAPVTILVDASYSMALERDGTSRLERLTAQLEEWMASQPEDTRYALLVAEHGSDVELRLPYPASSNQVSSFLTGVIPWGSIDLGGSIEKASELAASLAEADGEATPTLLVVSDGEDLAALTGARSFRVRSDVVLSTILSEPATPSGLHDVLRAISGSYEAPAPEPEPEPHAVIPTPPPGAPRAESRGLAGTWAAVARWVFLAATILGLAAVARVLSYHRARVEKVRRHNAQPPIVRLEIRGPSGKTQHDVTSYPSAFGAGQGAGIHKDLPDAEASFRLTLEEGRVTVSSESKAKINGVARSEHELSDRDQIRIGHVRIIVREIERVKPMRPPRARHRFYPVAPAAAAALTVIAFVLSRPIESAPRTATATAAAGPGISLFQQPIPDPPETSAPLTFRTPSAIDTPPLPPLRLPRVVPPDADIPSANLDFLLIHAHPDDEALDFGGILARLSSAGLRGAVVLMTDGNAGLDQYPWRETDAQYPAYDLADAKLASIRIQEAREAIGWLGVETYIRLGLENHPYGSLEQTMSPEEIMEAWGGRRELTDRLSRIIRSTRPELLLSPDGPGPAFEHFEHEATGILVEETLRRLQDRGESPVEAHLVSVDPLQIDGYEDLWTLSPWTPAADGSVPRLRQLYALRAHRTQRDATVVGTETRMAIPVEHFRVKYLAPDLASTSELSRVLVDLGDGAP